MSSDHQNESMADKVARAEQAMRASELSYRRLFEAAKDGILILDADTGRINDVNPFLIELLGFSWSEMVGKTVGELSPFKDIESNQSMLERLQQHGYVRYEDLPLETRDGRHIAVEFVSNVYQAGDRKVIQCNIRDITQRKWSNEALRKSEENFRGIFANAPVGIFQSTASRLLTVNPALARAFGYESPAEMIASSVKPEALFVQPEQRRQIIREAMELEAYAEQEVEYRRKDGSTFTANLRMRAVRDNAGGIEFLRGFIEDITKNKRAEEALRASEAHYRLLADNLADVLWTFDLQTMRCTYVSPSVRRLRGYTAEEAIAQSLEQMLTPESVALVKSLLTGRIGAFLAGDPAATTQVHELNLMCQSGATICAETVTTFLRNKEGGLSVVGVSRDITERVRGQKMLQESEARLRAFTEAAFDGIVVSEAGTFVDVNQRMAQLLGYEISELVGRKVADIVAPEDRSLVQHNQASGLEHLHEATLVRKDGSVITVEARARHCIYSDRPMRMTAVHDITSRRHSEAQVNQLLRQQQAILDTSPIGIAYNNGRNIQWANPMHHAMFGYQSEEMHGMDTSRFYVRMEDYERVGREASVRIAQGLTYRAEVEFQRRNGERFWCLIQSRAINANASLEGVIWMLMDVTERKMAEKSLRDSEEKFRNIFANAPVGIFQSTADRLLVANPAMARMFGYESPAEMTTNSAHAESFFVQPEQRRKIIREAVESGRYVQHEFQEHRKDGSTFTTKVRMRAVCDEAGQIKFIEGFVEDITKRKEAKAELLKMSQALEQSPVTIVITDLAGNIEYVNPAFTRLTGYTRKEALGKNPRILKSGKTAPEDYKRLWEAITNGREWRGELLNKAKGGRLFWESAVISPVVNKAGQITHFLAVKEDITQQKHLEEQLRQAQKMEAVGQLAGGVAHDFNNIIVATLMHLGLMQDNPHLSLETKESLREVEKETMRAANLTRQLLLFSRQQAARIGPLEMNALIHDLLKMLRRLLGENIEIIPQVSSDAMWVNADAGMMEQVVMNLCINARDAMAGGGRLTIATKVVEIQDQPVKNHADARPGRFVCLSVSDTGCGMEETVLERIFEPFFTTKEAGKGTGLGLATVYGIAKQHAGWVEVKSVVGRGSSFRVYLPETKPAGATVIASHAEGVKGGSETILVVEDEVYVRRLAALCLRKLGYAVLEAGDALEALKIWQEHHEKIALLFTDTLMPGNMTGLDLAVRLKKEKGSLKIISSSGYSADPAATLAAGQEISYLPKPYTPAAMAKAVRRCLDNP